MSKEVGVPAADDLVEALLAHFPENEPAFTTDREQVHRAFYQLKQQHAGLFADFVFNLDRGFPYCEDIEFALSCLAGASLIRTENVYLERFQVTPQLTDHFDTTTKANVPVDEESLVRMSKELQETLRLPD